MPELSQKKQMRKSGRLHEIHIMAKYLDKFSKEIGFDIEYKQKDLENIVKRADTNLVKYLLTISTTLESFNKIKLIFSSTFFLSFFIK